MCLPVILESIGHGESKQSLLFTVYFPSFFFRPYSFQPSWGNLQLEFWGRTVERQSCILCCLLPRGMLLWPGLQRAFWRRLPPPQMYTGVCTCGWKLTPTSFHLLGASQPVSAGQQRESPRPGSCTQPLSNPSFRSPMEFWVVLLNLGSTGIFLGVYKFYQKFRMFCFHFWIA